MNLAWTWSGAMSPGGAEALVKFAEMTKEARIVDLVVEGSRAALLYDCELPHPVGKLKIVSFFRVEKGKSACTKRCSMPRSFASFRHASAMIDRGARIGSGKSATSGGDRAFRKWRATADEGGHYSFAVAL